MSATPSSPATPMTTGVRPATDEWFKWTDLLAEVARLAIQDGRRLEISDGPDGPIYRITDEPDK